MERTSFDRCLTNVRTLVLVIPSLSILFHFHTIIQSSLTHFLFFSLLFHFDIYTIQYNGCVIFVGGGGSSNIIMPSSWWCWWSTEFGPGMLMFFPTVSFWYVFLDVDTSSIDIHARECWLRCGWWWWWWRSWCFWVYILLAAATNTITTSELLMKNNTLSHYHSYFLYHPYLTVIRQNQPK